MIDEIDSLPDRVSEIFKDQTILISGGSGFLGKLLIEKLLRCCNGLKRIYLIVRNKKGKSAEDRLEDIFNNVVFDLLKEKYPESLNKCRVINGDVSEIDLGISSEDRKILQDEINFIYHSAASTRFDDSVKTAVKINTRGTKYMLDLAKQCKNLKIFVHLSTAYAFPKEKVLYEKPYKPPADPHMVLDKINSAGDEEIEKLLGDCPNTYTFSKALAEGLVVETMSHLPSIIIRPSVVCPTLMEPLPGWCNNLQGPMGLFVGAGKGIIRSMYMKGESYADFIPADITINAVIAETWNFLNHKTGRILNITASSEYNFTWEEIIEMGKDVIYNDIPFNGVVWYPGGSLKKSKLVHNLCFYLFQIIPAIFIDALLIILGYKPILYQIQKRIQKGSEVFEYYTNKAWNFSNMKAIELREKLNEKEKKNYKVDGDGIDVKDYLRKCMLCVRRNNLKELDDTLPSAKRHMKIMKIVDILCKSLFVLVTLYYLYKWSLEVTWGGF